MGGALWADGTVLWCIARIKEASQHILILAELLDDLEVLIFVDQVWVLAREMLVLGE